MSSHIGKWRRTGITQDVMKNFFHMYACTPNQVKFSEGAIKTVQLREVIPDNDDWHKTIERYDDLLDRIEANQSYEGSAWEKHEIHNETKDIRARFVRFENLYYSIKRNGFKPSKPHKVILLYIRDLKRRTPAKGGRISYKYYRINSMKRILICNYLGMKEIPAKVFGVKL